MANVIDFLIMTILKYLLVVFPIFLLSTKIDYLFYVLYFSSYSNSLLLKLFESVYS